jgi:hypothetical protein
VNKAVSQKRSEEKKKKKEEDGNSIGVNCVFLICVCLFAGKCVDNGDGIDLFSFLLFVGLTVKFNSFLILLNRMSQFLFVFIFYY